MKSHRPLDVFTPGPIVTGGQPLLEIWYKRASIVRLDYYRDTRSSRLIDVSQTPT